MVKRLSNKDFASIYAEVPRACVDLVIENKQGVLFTKRKIKSYYGMWHLPGGTILFKEPIYSAAKRIAKEELDLMVKPIKILGGLECFNKTHDVSLVILIKIISGNIKLDHQASKYGFFKISPKNTIKSHSVFIKTYFKN
ncbi:MAG: NUDIX domain-containing protein [Nanoarchaeota archaeon]|mgnify:CR=1 FL=1